MFNCFIARIAVTLSQVILSLLLAEPTVEASDRARPSGSEPLSLAASKTRSSWGPQSAKNARLGPKEEPKWSARCVDVADHDNKCQLEHGKSRFTSRDFNGSPLAAYLCPVGLNRWTRIDFRARAAVDPFRRSNLSACGGRSSGQRAKVSKPESSRRPRMTQAAEWRRAHSRQQQQPPTATTQHNTTQQQQPTTAQQLSGERRAAQWSCQASGKG